ncbi:MAG: MmcQ/YjbR family DNA-binding protein [Anaerofustis sp.]
MDHTQIASACMGYPHVRHEYKADWGAALFRIGEKIFALLGGDKTGEAVLSLKVPPELSITMRNTYEGKIIPGYHLNKEHWISIYLNSDIPDELIASLIGTAYETVLHSLPKKLQKELTDNK